MSKKLYKTVSVLLTSAMIFSTSPVYALESADTSTFSKGIVEQTKSSSLPAKDPMKVYTSMTGSVSSNAGGWF